VNAGFRQNGHNYIFQKGSRGQRVRY